MNTNVKIFINGNIITLNNSNDIHEAIVIKEDKIVYLGTNEECLKYKTDYIDTKVIDLCGKTLIPGFYDSHGHITMECAYKGLYKLDLYPEGNITTIKECIDLLKEEAKRKPKGEWVIGARFNFNLVKEKRHLTKEDLDEISTEHPVCVADKGGHFIYLNNYALKLGNITNDTPNPPGGEYGRDEKTNELNGMVLEKASLNYAINHIPLATKEDMIENIKEINDEFVEHGTTTANDAGVVGQGFRYHNLLQEASDSKIFKPRIRLSSSYDFTTDTKEFIEKAKQFKSSKKVTFGGIKFFSDGSMLGKTSYLTKPYKDTDIVGTPMFNQQNLDDFVEEVHRNNMQCIVHSNGDAAIDMLLDSIERAIDNNPDIKNLRHTILHIQTIRQDQLDRVKKLGIFPNFLSIQTYFYGDEYKEVILGEERSNNLNPLKWAYDRDLKFGIHIDQPLYKQKPLLAIHHAVNRKTYRGNVVGKEHKIPVIEALKAFTIYGAYQNFEEDITGSLEVGKLADMITLDKNILEVNSEEIKDIKVLETYVCGELVYKR